MDIIIVEFGISDYLLEHFISRLSFFNRIENRTVSETGFGTMHSHCSLEQLHKHRRMFKGIS